MTFRERLADWISGGAVTRARETSDAFRDMWASRRDAAWRDREKAQALGAIAAMETPGANATVRRMARIAREAME